MPQWQKTDAVPHSKRAELAKRSVLLINQHLCQNDKWNEQLIYERGADLAERIIRTWPGPDSDTWPSTTCDKATATAT